MVTVALSLSLLIPDTLRPFTDGVPVNDHLELEGIKNNVKCSYITYTVVLEIFAWY